jgi:hypothetical protein
MNKEKKLLKIREGGKKVKKKKPRAAYSYREKK